MKAKPKNSLEFTTQVVVRELWNGDVVVFPVADRTLASYSASMQDGLEQQRRFLGRYLAGLPPEELARFSLPEGVRLHETQVLVPREELPRRLRIREPLSVGAAVIPLARESWVVLLPLEHTLHVAQGKDLDEAIRSEVGRIVSARELSPTEYLQLLPPRGQRLEPITVVLELGEEAPEGSGRSLRRQLVERHRREHARRVLESIAAPLHERPEVRSGPPVLGREAELRQLGPLLGGAERCGALLLGSELAGKTALLYAWLRQEQAAGRGPLVYATSGSRLIAGMSGLGQWQERMGRVLKAAEDLDAVLYFEDLADLLAEHSSWIDLPGAMKPYLEEGRMRLCGELTPEGLDLFEARHAGFLSCLSRVRVGALGLEASRLALKERIEFWTRREPDRPNLAAEALQPLLDLTERYLPYQPLPGKAVRLYEELRATLRNERAPDGTPRPITTEKLIQAFSLRTGIPAFLLQEDRALRAEELARHFQKRLVGQEAAVRSVADTLCLVKAGLQPAGKPLATFLFIGPTGVGKTELARLLAELLFGSQERMVRFDMSEYMDPLSAERLIRGTQSADGLMTRKVREQPFCVLLLDEIEKAHPAVLDLLLQVCGEGRLTDARGKTAYFHNAILILTSNLGAAHRRAPIGIGAAQQSDERYYLRQVHQEFRPEFVNRIDRILVFRPLTAEQVREVARVALARIEERRGLAQAGLELRLGDGVLEALSREGYSEAYGARAMRRHLETHLVAPLARFLGRLGPEARGAVVEVAPGPGFELKRRKSGERGRAQLWLVEQLLALRREVDRWMALDTVESLRDQLSFLAAQLSARMPRGVRAEEDRRAARQRTELQREHHRLAAVWDKASALRADLEAVEELGLSALLEGEEARPFLDEARELHERFRAHLVSVLLAQEPRRNSVTLLVQEPDGGRAFDRWLLPLLRAAKERGWAVQAHADGDKDPESGWPEALRWGPARSADWLRERLERPDRTLRNVVLRCSGELAGALLALEGGLHRWRPEEPGQEPVHLLCLRIALRSELSREELARPELRPPLAGPAAALRAAPAVREHDPAEGLLYLLERKRRLELAPEEYWPRFEQIALEHLLHFEEDPELDREDLFTGLLDQAILREAQA
jgi:ATP-dependent Clp protease ATP-binding subunit ClpC